MHLHILGLGPIGVLLSHHLRRVLAPTHLVTRIFKSKRQAREAGDVSRVEVDGIVASVGGFRSEIFEASYPDSRPGIGEGAGKGQELNSPGEGSNTIESLLITTKANQTVGAVQRLLPRLSRNSTIVLMQNGMGIYEHLIHEIFRNPEQRPQFILASNTHGAWARERGNIVHTGIGEIEFGIVPDPGGRDFEAVLGDESLSKHERKLHLDDISDLSIDPSQIRYRSLRNTVAALCSLDEALNTSWKPLTDVQVAMRRKLVVNAIINPLTALMGCRNGDIFTTKAANRIMDRICDEASKAFEAQLKAETQVWLSSQGDENAHVPVGRVPRALTRPFLEEECKRVAELTKGNISSMLSDVRRGRATEIDYMNGYLLNLGMTYGIQMPATATLLNLVKMRSAIPLDQML